MIPENASDIVGFDGGNESPETILELGLASARRNHLQERSN